MPVKKVTNKSSRAVTPRKRVITKKVEENTVPMSSISKKNNPFTKKQIFEFIKKPQIFVPVAILLVALIVFFAKSWFVVAMVNGQFISRSAFESAVEVQAGKQVLSTLVTQVLLEQEASKKGIKINQSDIDDQEKKIDKSLATQGQTLDQALMARGMTKSDFEEQLRLQDILEKLLGNQIAVSDKEINDYIAQNKDSLPTGESDAQVKDTVKQQLQQQKLSTAAQDLIQKLQAQAKIKYFLNL